MILPITITLKTSTTSLDRLYSPERAAPSKAAVRKMWRKQGLILNIQAQDLLRSVHYRSESFGMAEGNSSYIYQNSRYQHVSLSLTWMFGQKQYVKRRNVGNMEEAERLGGGGKK